MDLQKIKQEAQEAVEQVLQEAPMEKGDIFVVGCSSSEVAGGRIGKASSPEIADAIFEGIYPVLKERGIFLAAQCCEHLNRAMIIERAAMTPGQEVVNAIPQTHAGGSFAVKSFKEFEDPVAVENVKATAGLDIGETMIGMHFKGVVVPLRIERKNIGEARILGARTRPKFVGGERAVYDEGMKRGYWHYGEK